MLKIITKSLITYCCPILCSVVPTTLPPKPTVGPGSCPSSEWYRYNEYCFLLRPDERVDFDTARLACEREAAVAIGYSTLTSVHDFSENSFIWQTMLSVTQYPTSSSCFIGLYNTATGV